MNEDQHKVIDCLDVAIKLAWDLVFGYYIIELPVISPPTATEGPIYPKRVIIIEHES